MIFASVGYVLVGLYFLFIFRERIKDRYKSNYDGEVPTGYIAMLLAIWPLVALWWLIEPVLDWMVNNEHE